MTGPGRAWPCPSGFSLCKYRSGTGPVERQRATPNGRDVGSRAHTGEVRWIMRRYLGGLDAGFGGDGTAEDYGMGSPEARTCERIPTSVSRRCGASASIGPAPEVVELLNESCATRRSSSGKRPQPLSVRRKSGSGIPNLRVALDDTARWRSRAARRIADMGDRNGLQLFQDTYSGQNKNQPGMIESAMRNAKAKLRSPWPRSRVMGVKEASGALLARSRWVSRWRRTR